MSKPIQTVKLTPEQKRSRRLRNIALALSLAGFAALLYAGTLTKLGANVLDRPL